MQPYLVTAMVCLVLAVLLNAALSITAALRGDPVFPSNFDGVETHLMIYGFILPAAVALSVRELPLFMRLAFPPDRGLAVVASYVACLILRIGSGIEQAFGIDLAAGARFAGLIPILEGIALLVFIFASAVAVTNGFTAVLGNPALLNPCIKRHAITVGFITRLIFGISVRRLPGFGGKSRVARNWLVLATFWLGNVALLFRVAPLFAPISSVAEIALGFSGTIGWLAVASLALNL